MAVIVIFPAFPCPKRLAEMLAPLVRDSWLVVILILPELPTPPGPTRLKTPLGKLLSAVSPSKEIVSLALIFTSPAFPCPATELLMAAPLVKNRFLALRLTAPALPTPDSLIKLLIPRLFPTLPSKEIVSLALMVTSPVSPRPLIELNILPPLVRERFFVVMLTLPVLPTPVSETEVKIPVNSPLKTTVSEALMFTSPAFPCPLITAKIPAPSIRDKFFVLIFTSPALPLALSFTLLKIPVAESLPARSKVTVSEALIIISPP